MYVGKGILISRLQTHGRQRSRWTYGVTLSTQDRSLDDGHTRWAEATLIARVKAAGWVELLNDRDERPPELAEEFLGDAEIILGMIGLPIGEPRAEPSEPSERPEPVDVGDDMEAAEAALLARVREYSDWVLVPALAHELGWRVSLGHSRGRILARKAARNLAGRGLLEISEKAPYRVRLRR